MLESYLIVTLVGLLLIVAIAWILFVVGSLRAESKSTERGITEAKEVIKEIRARLHKVEGSVVMGEEGLTQLLDRMENVLDKKLESEKR